MHWQETNKAKQLQRAVTVKIVFNSFTGGIQISTNVIQKLNSTAVGSNSTRKENVP